MAFVASWTAEPDFTPEAMARLREIDAEPFEAADPAEFEAFSGSVAQVAFSPRALACPRSVRQYLQERDPAAAARVIGEMERVCALIGAYPRTGPPIPGTGLRRHVRRRYRYRVIHRVAGDMVEVRDVMHPRRAG